MSKAPDIILQKMNRCGVATLNRPHALNAVSYDMLAQMDAQYIDWAGDPYIYGIVLRSSGGRAFCSGGDLKALYQWKRAGKLETILDKYTIEYQFNWTLDRFIKPHVALMDGLVFGGGVGISLYGTHKVAGENYRFAMPETAIGYFPDVGATHFLPRLPGQIGMYLALTGSQIDRADAYALGLLTHCIDAAEFDAIRETMCEAEPIDPVLDGRHIHPGPSSLLDTQAQIDRYFSAPTVEELLAALDGADAGDTEWARDTADTIRQKSPLSLKVAFHQMRRAGALSLDQALELEGRLARAFLSGEEVYEGIRALLVDKDGKPDWPSRSLDHVSDDMVAALFEPGADDGFKPVNPFV